MIVPNYWAEARASVRVKGRSITLRRFGWSDDSPADAQAQAELRVAEAAQLAASGQPVERRERKLAYNGAEGLPIREEVLARHGEAVITRNAYGARCLNVPDLLIADVDFETEPSARVAGVLTMAALVSGSFLAIRSGIWPAVVAAIFVSPIVGILLARLFFRLKPIWAGSPFERAQKRVQYFVSQHPDWRLRLYRTPAGLRLIATHARLAPTSEASRAFFDAVGADPVYARMCLNQHCFRARLSAKPWRIGIHGHLRPRPGVWPIRPEQTATREAWVRRYEREAEAYAACRYEETLGSGTDDASLAALVTLHDAESKALDDIRTLA